MMKSYELLDSVVERICCDVLSRVRVRKEIGLLTNPSEVIYVGNELWRVIFERGLKCPPETVSFLKDVIHKANERMRILSTRDFLTGLFNRRFLDSELKMQLASTYRNLKIPFSVIMFDIDYFKMFNDTYGHNAGDIVLKTLSGVVSKSIRSSDVAFRYGGEEFIILLPDTSKAEALDVAYRLNRQVAKTKVTFIDERGKRNNKRVTISVGVIEINKESPIWILYRVGGKQLVINYVNNDSNLEEILNYFKRYFVNRSFVRKDKLTKKDIKKGVKEVGDFVKLYILENGFDVRDISKAECAISWIANEVDSLVYYAKESGRNKVAYVDGDGEKTIGKFR